MSSKSQSGTDIQHGGFTQHSRFDVIQHQYAGGDDEGTHGYVEVLEIQDPPEGKHPIVVVFWGTGHPYQFWEFQSVHLAKEGLAKSFIDHWALPQHPGFIRYIKAKDLQTKPWFYAEEGDEIAGDFVVAKEGTDE